MHTAALILTSVLLGPVQPEAIFLDVREGKLHAVLDTSNPSDEYVLVVGSLASWNQACPIHLRAEPTTERPLVRKEASQPDEEAIRAGLRARKLALAEARIQAGTPDRFTPLLEPPPQKTFHLFVGERDLENRDQYLAVDARLHSFNDVCQVYADSDTPKSADQDAAAAEIVRCFKQEVLPWACKRLGTADDVDRDGRFTIFVTSRVGRMQKGKTALDGFVRGSDFFLELPPPFSNRCDMMVLNSALRAGAHLRTVLVHEYTHAVTFCGHALRPYSRGPRHQDEEAWLSESLAHLVEDLRGFSRSNLEPRVRAYLDAPQDYPLVIPDTFAAGMWRTAGVRGGGFLFLRHLERKAGADLLFQLAQSNLRGKENLETATEQPFARLFRGFGVELAERFLVSRGGDDVVADSWGGGPKARPLAMDDAEVEVRLPGTALCLFHLQGATASQTRVTMRCPPGVPIQATLVRLSRNR